MDCSKSPVRQDNLTAAVDWQSKQRHPVAIAGRLVLLIMTSEGYSVAVGPYLPGEGTISHEPAQHQQQQVVQRFRTLIGWPCLCGVGWWWWWCEVVAACVEGWRASVPCALLGVWALCLWAGLAVVE